MRKSVILTLAIACMALPAPSAEAQRYKRTDANTYYRAPGTAGGKTVVIPIGTAFEGRISQTISSSKSHAGQAFEIVMSSPVLANGTDVIIPAGSAVIGEVVEAVPSSRLPRKKKQPPPRGKLRIQVNGLRLPDGVQYPLVGNLAGEVGGRPGSRSAPLGTGIGYMGSAASFEAVSPAMSKLKRGGNNGRGPELVSKRDALRHEIYGLADDRGRDDEAFIRSLVLRKHDYWIDAGSPLTVRLAAPLKLAVTKPGEGVSLGSLDDAPPVESLPPPSRKQRAIENQAPPRPNLPVQGNAPQAPSSSSSPSADF